MVRVHLTQTVASATVANDILIVDRALTTKLGQTESLKVRVQGQAGKLREARLRRI